MYAAQWLSQWSVCAFFYEATCIHVKTSPHATRCIDPSLGMNGCSRLTWCPRIILDWEAVGLHHSWKPQLFRLVTVARVTVPFFMVTGLYLFPQPRSLALL